MLLACDIGNTFIKIAVYDNDKLVIFSKTSQDNFSPGYFKKYKIDKIAISSVVPAVEQTVRSGFEELFGIVPLSININSQFDIKINYKTPASLGIDRICSVEGAFSLFKNDPLYKEYNKDVFLLTIDSGTATTINIVKYNAEFIGGLITPGINTMINSLNKGTAQLPEINITSDYNGLIGNDTKSCIASGVLNSTLGFIEKTYHYLTKELNAKIIKLYITGGNGKIISNNLIFENIFVEDLVLLGVKSVSEKDE